MTWKSRHALLLSTALAVWLSVGAASADPLPVVNFGASPGAPNGVAVVRRGDSLSAIAARYKVSQEGLIRLNGLKPPYKLAKGQRLSLPLPREHRVREAETLYSISRLYNVSLHALAKANSLKEPYMLQKGKVLRLPAGEAPPVAAAPPRQKERAKTVFVLNAPSPAKAAPLLKTPGPSPEREAFEAMIAKLADLEESPKRHVSPLLQTAAVRGAAPALLPDPMRAGFIWPVRGHVISGYGPKGGGLYNDGINIAAPRGAPVAAAADGTVAYVGDSLKSYGNLVLIRHSGGMVTAYAHLNTVTVKTGMQVMRGETIGSVGSSGSVDSAQLHFEVRRGKDPVDPRRFLAQS